jgi:hypothetical protein
MSVRAVAVALLCGAPTVHAAHFDSALSGAQIELEYQRLRASHEIKIDTALPWVFSFSGPDSAKVEALSLRLVRDGFRIVSLQTADGVTTLRVTRTELLTSAALDRRNHELSKLAATAGVPSYDGADVSALR